MAWIDTTSVVTFTKEPLIFLDIEPAIHDIFLEYVSLI